MTRLARQLARLFHMLGLSASRGTHEPFGFEARLLASLRGAEPPGRLNGGSRTTSKEAVRRFRSCDPSAGCQARAEPGRARARLRCERHAADSRRSINRMTRLARQLARLFHMLGLSASRGTHGPFGSEARLLASLLEVEPPGRRNGGSRRPSKEAVRRFPQLRSIREMPGAGRARQSPGSAAMRTKRRG